MSWTAPATVTAGQLMTAAFWNTHVRDNALESAPAKVTTAGDIVYGTGANALARLAAGVYAGHLGMNAAATAPEWIIPPTSVRVATSETTSSATYVTLTTPCAVTAVTGTKAIVIYSVMHSNNTNGNWCMASLKISGATTLAAQDTWGFTFFNTANNMWIMGCQVVTMGLGGLVGALTAGSNTFTIMHRTSGGTYSASNREVTVIPL